ncbi:MAG: hypothetical protein ABIO80_05530, partial [Sphingomicrobium sp.]
VSLSESHSDDDEVIDQSDRCWKDEVDNMWLTDFPPPAGFDGYESSPWGSSTSYERACTPDEVRLLEANQAAIAADERTEEEELRDTWFALLADEAADDAVDDAPDEAVEDARHKRAAL